MLAVMSPTRIFAAGGFFASAPSFFFVLLSAMTCFPLLSGRLHCQPVISSSPDKAVRPTREGDHPPPMLSLGAAIAASQLRETRGNPCGHQGRFSGRNSRIRLA